MSLQGRETEFQGQTRRKGAGGNGSKLTAGSEGGLLAQSCPTLLDPVDCSPPGSSVHGVLQARILEWVAISFSRGSSSGIEPTSPALQASLYGTVKWGSRKQNLE